MVLTLKKRHSNFCSGKTARVLVYIHPSINLYLVGEAKD